MRRQELEVFNSIKEPRNNSIGSYNRYINYTFIYRNIYIKAFAKTILFKTTVL
jgi:hypothetical protein